MRKSSIILYDLIHSLTKSEKRYIKVKAQDADTEYLKLFDILLKQQIYDEDEIKKRYHRNNFAKNLSVSKRYLYDYILDQLEKYSKEKIYFGLLSEISKIDILISRGFYKNALKEIKRSKDLALENELFEATLLLIKQEKSILTKTRGFFDITQVEKLFKEEKRLLDILDNINSYWLMMMQIYYWQMYYSKSQNKSSHQDLKDITDSPLFKDIGNASSLQSKIYYFQLKAAYNFMVGNSLIAYESNLDFLELMESSKSFIRNYPQRYLGLLNNILIDSLELKKYDELDIGLNKLSNLLVRKEFKLVKNIDSIIFRQFYLLTINKYVQLEQFASGAELIPIILEGLEQNKKSLSHQHKTTFYYLISYLSFMVNDYEMANKYVNVILNDNNAKRYKELFNYSRLLDIIIHFELGNSDLVESLIISKRRVLGSKNIGNEVEIELLKFLVKLDKHLSKKDKRLLIDDFWNYIARIKFNPSKSRILNYFNIEYWLEQKVI